MTVNVNVMTVTRECDDRELDSTSGDITSMKFNDSSKKSQIASGIGASCSWVQGGHDNNYITITCTTSTLTHTTAEPDVGELRFIARLNKDNLPNGYTVSDMEGGTAIEGSDVFLVNGQTRSKFYSSRQFIDDQIHGVSGSSIAAWMIIPGIGYELASGGPFFRDIDNQGSAQQELYYCKNSNHAQSESYRQGLHGPYALWFTTGSEPDSDYSTDFWADLGISGYVAKASRGRLTGTATGFPSAYASYISIGWSNSAVQYWVRTDSSGSYVSPYMKPGTYTMTLYRMELAIASQSVLVTAGAVGSSNIASTETTPTTIWQIGDYDGTPRGFLNADLIETMHPSDSRMSDWGPVTFAVGADVGKFPMALFKDIGSVTITFTLTSFQIGARTLEIATTLAFAGGRPQVVINGDWTGPAPSAPSTPDSRGVTRGTWRGVNAVYTVNIDNGVLVSGSNSIVINVISGSSGSDYLSPNFVFDSVRLY
ncbi:polysaccharide lyase family 4 protein [Hymenopellis radicata]|nr:polysaccharide lyase family 4 protein [Hymenopellis radicata]